VAFFIIGIILSSGDKVLDANVVAILVFVIGSMWVLMLMSFHALDCCWPYT
jgi:hypothetical protein